MRVSDYILKIIHTAVAKSFGKCEIILFGSRVDESKKGGDFDIAIKSDLSKEAFRKAKVQFFKQFILHDLDLPIDLVAYNHIQPELKKEIDTKGVRL